jgi:hypothetical protein
MLADFNRENDFEDPPRVNEDDDSRQEVGIDGPEAERLFRQMIHSQSREAHEIRASQKAPATPDSMQKADVEDLEWVPLVTTQLIPQQRLLAGDSLSESRESISCQSSRLASRH